MTKHEERYLNAQNIKKAYEDAEKALAKVGKLLRKTHYGWATGPATMITGMKTTLYMLRFEVPYYEKCPRCGFEISNKIDDYPLAEEGVLYFKCSNLNCNHIFNLG